MSNPFIATVGSLAAAANNNIVASNTPATAGALALVGGGTVTLDNPRRVAVTYGNEAVARAVVIAGTTFGGYAINETLTVPAGGAGSPINTVQDFLTVTSVTVAAAWSAAMSVGTIAEASTPWFITDWLRNPYFIGFGCRAVTGTFSSGWLIECTFDDPNAGYAAPGSISVPSTVDSNSNIPPFIFSEPTNFGAQAGTKKTVNFAGSINTPFFAVRGTLFDTGVKAQFSFLQSGIGDA